MNIIADLLLSYVDLTVAAIELFDPHRTYGRPIKDYQHWRKESHISSGDLSHLKNGGYLIKKKDKFVISSKGNKAITRYLINNLEIPIPKKWDCLWRIVIFDIPEEKKSVRNIFRRRLRELGLEMLQKSVFCYPHDCVREITFLTKTYKIERYVTYMEVSNIITGKNIFKTFKDHRIIN